MARVFPKQSKMDSVTTKNLGPKHHEVIGIETTFGPRDLDKIPLDGGSKVKNVGSK